MRPVPPKPGAVAAFAGFAGLVLVELNVFLHEKPALSASFSLSSRFGPDPRASADAAGLLHAWCTHSDAVLRCSLLPGGEISGRSQDLDGADLAQEMEWRRGFYEDLAYLEDRLGVELLMPDHMSDRDIAAITQAAAVLRAGQGVGEVHAVSGMVDNPLEIPRLPDMLAKRSPIRRELTYPIFGQDVSLGMAEYEVPRMRIVDILPHGQTATSPARVILEPEDKGQAPFHLLDFEPDADAQLGDTEAQTGSTESADTSA